jgi:transcription elongation factor Elf1
MSTEYVKFENCPLCGSQSIVKLPIDWQGNGIIPIVACGNPFHYTEASLNDRPSPMSGDEEAAA